MAIRRLRKRRKRLTATAPKFARWRSRMYRVWAATATAAVLLVTEADFDVLTEAGENIIL